MFNWLKIYYKLINLSLNILVKSKSIPVEPVMELGLDISCPIIYILPHTSKVDLLALRTRCLVHDLPDPLDLLNINGKKLPRYIFIHNKSHMLTYYSSKDESIFSIYLELHRKDPDLDIQAVPISVMFGRHPGHEEKEINSSLHIINWIEKFFSITWLGRDSFVCFFPFVSLRRMVMQYGTDKSISYKLARVARMHFIRQRLAASGPRLFTRQNLFKKILSSEVIIHAIQYEARIKKISQKMATQNAINLIKEIAANFSYEAIRLTDRILGLIWNRLYQGISVYNVERVRQLVRNGFEIVYIPCHRSHMDYLLLSYVLYHHGLVPPHIAAGINLNFWPVGSILRRLGAFFIRRTFKRNKLYSAIFREYLSELFSRGYSIEYFVEGGRSRTGFLLDPKTGTLSMTIQAMLRGDTRPITLVPIYIGYENVIEVSSYVKELRGALKEKESFSKMLRSLRKLHNLGYGYVNFGTPLPLITWLNQNVPKWRESIYKIKDIKPIWLTPTVNSIAVNLMVRINNASTVNAMNLCCTALLASRQRSLTRNQLSEQLNCYLDLMRNVPYSGDSIIPSITAKELIDHALKMKKFKIEKDMFEDIITLPCKQATLMTYYRNNILHMLMLPSLVALIIFRYCRLSYKELFHHVLILYPLLKSELFLRWNSKELQTEMNKLIDELVRQKLIFSKNGELLINPSRTYVLQLLSASVCETLQRYAITFWLMKKNPSINRNTLKKESFILAKRLSFLHNIDALEFFDKKIFNTLVLILHEKGYIGNSGNIQIEQSIKVYRILSDLITPDIRATIEGMHKNSDTIY